MLSFLFDSTRERERERKKTAASSFWGNFLYLLIYIVKSLSIFHLSVLMPAASAKKKSSSSSKGGGATAAAVSSSSMEEKLASHLEMQKKFVTVGFSENKHTQERAYFNAYSGGSGATEEDEDPFTLESFRKNFTIKVTENNESTNTLEFEMEGISAAFANAFRRIITAEVPSMAIERVYFRQNTSVIADEIFAHRLGLVPILADPNEFESFDKDTHTDLLNEKNTIVFKLHVKCQKERDASGNIVPDSILHEKVYSKDLVWLPNGSELEDESQGGDNNDDDDDDDMDDDDDEKKQRKKKKIKTFSNFSASQEKKFGKDGIKTVHDDILLAKLVPGQEIELEAHCMKSIGADHAKFSPVGTCWYRLVPTVYFKKPIVGADAKIFMSECSDPIPNHQCFELKGSGEKAEVKIKSIRGCDLCLERIRELSGESGWDSKIAVLKKRDHYIFTIESVGARKPDVIFKEAVNILKSKCHSALGRLL